MYNVLIFKCEISVALGLSKSATAKRKVPYTVSCLCLCRYLEYSWRPKYNPVIGPDSSSLISDSHCEEGMGNETGITAVGLRRRELTLPQSDSSPVYGPPIFRRKWGGKTSHLFSWLAHWVVQMSSSLNRGVGFSAFYLDCTLNSSMIFTK